MKAEIIPSAECAKDFNLSVMNHITYQREESVRNLVAAFRIPESDVEVQNDTVQKLLEN